MGINLSAIKYYSSQLPFIDEFKSSKHWLTQKGTIWDTQEANLLDLDLNGWVRSLHQDTKKVQYDKVSTVLFRGHSHYLPGKYIVLYEGEGTINYRFDAEQDLALSTPGRDVIDVQPSNKGILLTITETDPHQTGNYLRNIRVIHETEEFATTIFNPEFLSKIEPFGTLRFMDWMETNNSQQQEWADRPKPEDTRYSQIGAPVEIMVELANQTDTNPWFTMPHLATDEYISNFARYVAKNLEPELTVYVEYSNEVWNSQFEQFHWARQQAEEKWSNSDLNAIDWYSFRTTEVVKIWEDAFSQNRERIIGVMGAQAANKARGQQALEYRWSDRLLSHLDTGIDAIAIAPYFGRYLGDRQNSQEVISWTRDADGGLDKLFQEITQGGILSRGPEGGGLADAYQTIESYSQIATEEDLQLIAYEGGQHIAGFGGIENNQDLTNLFIAANQDPRMGSVYRDYLEQWSNLGGDLFAHYNDIRTPNKWGSWGALESVYQDSSPKYDSIVNYALQEQTVFPRELKALEENAPQIVGEVGTVSQFNHQSQTIQFQNSYSNPVLFALPLSRKGADPAIVRITDLHSDNFTAFLQEPEYKKQWHVKESFSYLVVEAGSWKLGNGSLLEVGLSDLAQSTTSDFTTINFANSFATNPVILSQVQTYNDREFLRTRQQNTSIDGFSLTLEEEEALRQSGHGTETVGWLAIEPGVNNEEDFSYQAGRIDEAGMNSWYDIDLELELENSPHLLASLSSYNDPDSAGLRFRESHSHGIEVMIEEDKSLDRESIHGKESVDFIAISDLGNLFALPYP